MPGSVEHRSNDYGLLLFENFVDHSVREAVGVTPANIPVWVTPGVQHGIFRKGIPDANHFLNKLVSQSWLPRLVPGRCVCHVSFHFRTELDAPFHRESRERTFAFIASRDTDDFGFRRWPASRSSTKDRSSIERSGSSNSSARLISTCRSAMVSLGNSASTSEKLIRKRISFRAGSQVDS